MIIDSAAVVGLYIQSYSVWISMNGDNRFWRIGADDIWYAFIKALEESEGEKHG